MISAVTDWFRLLGAGFRLTRHDALIPKEYTHLLPGPVRLFGAATRMGAKRTDNGRTLRLSLIHI